MSEEIKKNPFWRKKFYHALSVRDINKDGFISRSDFDIIVQRYKNMGSPPEHIKKLKDTFEKCFVAWGISDDKVLLSYEEFGNNYIAMLTSSEKGSGNPHVELFLKLFDQIDLNHDESISFREWEMHYESIGIDVVHARASFDAMDENKDGMVSKDEFVQYHKEFFLSTENELNSSILFGPLD